MENTEHENLFPEQENVTCSPNDGFDPAPETGAENMDAQAAPASEWASSASRETRNHTYHGIGTGRKESPFADSPYVMQNRPQPQQRYQPGPQTTYRYQPQYEAPKPERTAKKKGGFWKKAIAVVAALCVVAGSCSVTAMLVNDYWEDRTTAMENRFQQQIEQLKSEIDAQSPAVTGNSVSGTLAMAGGYSAGQVYAQNVQSVVLIESTITSSFYGQTTTGVSAGSGFVLTEDGYVVTNHHVIEGAGAVTVVMYDGTRYSAQVVGSDSTNDIAVLKMAVTGLDPVTLGSSTDLIVGDQVVAIGNPLGELTSTLTVGYVSAKERDVTTDGTIINMIQTDAAINSGNSGGPLFNMKGEVIGITTAKYSGSSSSGASIEGIGFAIPIDDVLDGISQLMEYGYIRSAYMGVVVQNMDASTAQIYGLPIGAYVVSVEEGGAAQRAGIQPKDIITKVGNIDIESLADLTRAMRQFEPGDVAEVKLYRSGMEKTLRITLDERPRDADTATPDSENMPQMPEGSYEDWFNYFYPFFGNGNGG